MHLTQLSFDVVQKYDMRLCACIVCLVQKERKNDRVLYRPTFSLIFPLSVCLLSIFQETIKRMEKREAIIAYILHIQASIL